MPYCPHCGSIGVYQMRDRKTGERNKRYLWRCRDCNRQFTVRVGMVLEESRIPLRHWCYALWRACTSKKGVAALEIKRQTGLSYKSALFLMHRIRWAMAPANAKDASENGKLTGIVEADETYVGGKPRHRHPYKPIGPADRPSNQKTRKHRHTPVFAAVQRGGGVRVRVLPEVTAETLAKAVREHIDTTARLMTDEHSGYITVGKEFATHDQIQHKNYIYARGDVTTNGVEGFFSILKRGVKGIYHNVSRKHLQRYLDEFEYRFTNRKLEDGERVVKLITNAEGKRLAAGYKPL